MKKCEICSEPSDGRHFGVVSCRACAQFFRRCLTSDTNFVKPCDIQCELNIKCRRLCSMCRFQKCKAVGMCEKHEKPKKGKMLKRLSNFYRRLENRKLEEWPIREEVRINYILMNATMKQYSIIISKELEIAFPEIKQITEDQLKIIRDNFILSFLLVEISFKSKIATRLLLPNGAYIDYQNFDLFYDNLIASKLYKPYWDFRMNNLVNPIIEAKLNESEFQFLSALIFWDASLPNLSSETVKLCQKNRQEIFKELSDYTTFMHQDKSSIRVAKIVLLLNGISVSVETFNHQLIISKLHGVEIYHETMHTLNGLEL
ncbi:unnamed protein product [Caenorhabditis angaria]|uniref:Nuclear receptor domain-containing protein n=1 Tax=Caenorhabditis angaria TaxID=860376 RepID=A0A9P1IUG4_9PELO|nr:unnamed protein product [Caenorhabditis angaria]